MISIDTLKTYFFRGGHTSNFTIIKVNQFFSLGVSFATSMALQQTMYAKLVYSHTHSRGHVFQECTSLQRQNFE